jgi:GTP-binding protein
MQIETVEFIKSAYLPRDLLENSQPEIVFSGRSNVGKSSLINSLLRRKNIARISSTPGKTVHVNYFLINGQFYFVDLPGYGYAKVPDEERRRWYSLVESYFQKSKSIAIVVHLIDSRRGLMDADRELNEWLSGLHLHSILVLTKSDKLKHQELSRAVQSVKSETGSAAPLISVSAKTGKGIPELWDFLENSVIPQRD